MSTRTSGGNPPQAQLDLFCERLPARPYHTDDYEFGTRIRDVQRALKARYIQPNGPTHRYWLTYDVDRPLAAVDWSDRHAPPPTLVAQNPDNGHAHLLYGLAVPVRTAEDGRLDPLRYAAAVDIALAGTLAADLGYSGHLCKNPVHPHWRVTSWAPELYTLGDLDSWLDLSAYADKRKRLPDYGLGRNCNLFENLRHWAYRAIRQGWPTFEQWREACRDRARGYNAQFDQPLDLKEVRHTADSVARWTHRNMSPAAFAAVQSRRGRQGGRRKGAKRRDELMPQVQALAAQGASQREIAEAVGVSQQTVGNWLRRGDKIAISDNSAHEGLTEGGQPGVTK